MSQEINKIAAAVLTAGVIGMLSGFVADQLYHVDESDTLAYKVALPESDTPAPAAPAKPTLEPVAPLLASASVSKGENIAKQCSACHSFDKGGPTKVGPNLYEIVDAKIAEGRDGYDFSDGLKTKAEEVGGTWTYANLNGFLHDPRAWAPGTRMSYNGVKKVGDRADLIAYLRSLSDSPAPLPTAAEIKADEKAEEPAKEASAAGTTSSDATSGTAATSESAEKPADSKDETAKTDDTSETAAKADDSKPAETAAAASGGSGEEKTETAAKADDSKPAETKAAASGGSGEEKTETAAKADDSKPAETASSATAASSAGASEAKSEQTASADTSASSGDTTAAAASGGSAKLSELGQMIADANATKGKQVARQCVACHSFEQGGPNKIGPNLYGVLGETAGQGHGGFNFSSAMKEKGASGFKWTYKNLNDYLENPRGVVPGTRMTYAGLRKAQDRADVIAYIRSLDENAPPLP